MYDHAAILREFADSFTPFSATWRAMTEAADALDALLRERGELADAINAIDALVPGEAPLVERVRALVSERGEAQHPRATAVLRDDRILSVLCCPYCAKIHHHGAGGGYGHRVAHCGRGGYVLVPLFAADAERVP